MPSERWRSAFSVQVQTDWHWPTSPAPFSMMTSGADRHVSRRLEARAPSRSFAAEPLAVKRRYLFIAIMLPTTRPKARRTASSNEASLISAVKKDFECFQKHRHLPSHSGAVAVSIPRLREGMRVGEKVKKRKYKQYISHESQ